MRAFDQDAPPRLQALVQIFDPVDDVREQPLRGVERLGDDIRFARQRLAFERARTVRKIDANLFGERFAAREIAEENSGARDFIDVGRTDAATGGTDRLRAASAFARAIGGGVVRQHDVRAVGDLDARDVDADRRQSLELAEQAAEADDGAAADKELDAFVEHARRHDAQRDLGIADDDLMPGIISAAKSGDDIIVGRIQIDDAALAFVTPLNTHDYVGFADVIVGPQGFKRHYASSVPPTLRAGPPITSAREAIVTPSGIRGLRCCPSGSVRRLAAASSRTPRRGRWASRNPAG